jgi:HSP20 family protein
MITLFKDPFFDVFDKVFETSNLSVFNPQVNLTKNENGYKLLMSVPGLSKEDIKIKTKEGVITISYEKEEKTDDLFFVSSFKKSYTLPEDVKEKDIEGRVENGVLELKLPTERKKNIERLISIN